MKKKVLLVFGCQRSGTTATIEFLKKQKGIMVFNETNEIIHSEDSLKFEGGEKMRLQKVEELCEIIDQVPENKIVIKPLVESQNAGMLLDNIPNSVGLWLYRKPEDVIASMITKWGGDLATGFVNAIKFKQKGNWRAEKVDKRTSEMITFLVNSQKDLSVADKCGLFWYTRNRFFFKENLFKNPKITTVKYNRLVTKENYLGRRLAKVNYPIVDSPESFFTSNSVGKGNHVKLHPVVYQLCYDLFNRLNNY